MIIDYNWEVFVSRLKRSTQWQTNCCFLVQGVCWQVPAFCGSSRLLCGFRLVCKYNNKLVLWLFYYLLFTSCLWILEFGSFPLHHVIWFQPFNVDSFEWHCFPPRTHSGLSSVFCLDCQGDNHEAFVLWVWVELADPLWSTFWTQAKQQSPRSSHRPVPSAGLLRVGSWRQGIGRL